MKLRHMFSALIAVIFMQLFVCNISADVLVSPYGDGFYDKYYKECKYINKRCYNVISDCIIQKNPESKKELVSLKKGDTVWVDFSYTDKNGVVWGSSYIQDMDRYGWLEMKNLQVIYDTYSFMDEHSEEIREYGRELDSYRPTERVVIWEYPFADKPKAAIAADKWWVGDEAPFTSIADYSWTDKNGNVWCMSYAYAEKEDINKHMGWVFAANPETDDKAQIDRVYENASEYDDVSAGIGTAVSGSKGEMPDHDRQSAMIKSFAGNERDFTLPVVLTVITAVLSIVMISIMKRS